ncbi:unnamed protein product, partial [Allacma fusca]
SADIAMRKSNLVPQVPEPDYKRLARETQAKIDKDFGMEGKQYGRYSRVTLPTEAYLKLKDLASQAPSQDSSVPEEAPHGYELHPQTAEDCQINFDVHYGLDATVSGPDDVCVNRDSASSERDSSAGVAMVQSKRDPLLPAHYFKAPEHDHRFQYDNLRDQHRQWRKNARKTPEYKEKLKQKKKTAIEKKVNAETHITQIDFLLNRVSTSCHDSTGHIFSRFKSYAEIHGLETALPGWYHDALAAGVSGS